MRPALPFRPLFLPARNDVRSQSSPRVHRPLEWALTLISGAHLCLLPWAFGGMHLLCQEVSLVISVSALLIALVGVQRSLNQDRPLSLFLRDQIMRNKAIVASGFVLGLYLLIQGINPAWQFQSDQVAWRLLPRDYIHWLPHGVSAPFERSDVWRVALVWSSLAFQLAALCLGISRTKHLLYIATAIILNGMLVSLAGILQKMGSAKNILWIYPSNNHRFFATFIYPNHAGAYLNLLVALSAALVSTRFRGYLQARGEPIAALCAFAGGMAAVGCIFSLSRMSILLLGSFLLFAAGSTYIAPARSSVESEKKSLPLRFALILAMILGSALLSFEGRNVWTRFAPLVNKSDEAYTARLFAQHAALDLFKANPCFGVGAGCFRYLFPLYVQNYPPIYDGGHLYWEHAHNDWLEWAGELGVVGLGPIILLIGSIFWIPLKTALWKHPFQLLLTAGCTLTLLHAGVDFVLQCPAILFTWGFMLLLACHSRPEAPISI